MICEKFNVPFFILNLCAALKRRDVLFVLARFTQDPGLAMFGEDALGLKMELIQMF